MRQTEFVRLYPLGLGLDKNSTPGTQDPRSLIRAKNVSVGPRPALRKRPGLKSIPGGGKDTGVQAMIHFFATTGSSQQSEIIRVRKGRIEAFRRDAFNDLGIQLGEKDNITFERAENALIIHSENAVPYIYTLGGTPTALSILTSHESSAPTFSRYHHGRLWYGGRPASRHRLWVSAPFNINDYTLNSGGFSLRVREGDGDPRGLTGISPAFRGDIYPYKWAAIYRIALGSYGYEVIDITDQGGAVSQKAIQGTQNDVYSVDTAGLRSLALTDKYGAAEAYTLTYPIYDYFQENVNWDLSDLMILTYHQPDDTLLLAYPSAGSTVNDRVLAYNLTTKQFTEWEDCEYPTMGTYFDMGRKTTFVQDEQRGMGILDRSENTLLGDPISMEFQFGVSFPKGAKEEVTFQKGWLLAKPTLKSTIVGLFYSIDDAEEIERLLDTYADGYGSLISDSAGGIIGTDKIGEMPEHLIVIPFEFEGEGHSVRFRIKQDPNENDPDQSCEVYGIVYEIAYNEDDERGSAV